MNETTTKKKEKKEASADREDISRHSDGGFLKPLDQVKK